LEGLQDSEREPWFLEAMNFVRAPQGLRWEEADWRAGRMAGCVRGRPRGGARRFRWRDLAGVRVLLGVIRARRNCSGGQTHGRTCLQHPLGPATTALAAFLVYRVGSVNSSPLFLRVGLRPLTKRSVGNEPVMGFLPLSEAESRILSLPSCLRLTTEDMVRCGGNISRPEAESLHLQVR